MLLNAALRVMPRVILDRFVLGGIRIAESVLRDVEIRVATTPQELLAAARLVHDSYVQRGITGPHPSGLMIHPQAVVPTSLTFVAIANQKVIGTMSLLRDSPLGLPMDGTFLHEVNQFRARGETFAEVSALAVARQWRKTGLFYLLNRIMSRTAMNAGLDRILMSIAPRSRELYRSATLMEPFGSERSYAGAGITSRCIAMTLPLADIRPRLHAAFGHMGPVAGNAEYLTFDLPCPKMEIPSRETIGYSEARTDAYASLVRARMDLFRDLPERKLSYLKRALPGVLWPSRSSVDWNAELTGSQGHLRAANA